VFVKLGRKIIWPERKLMVKVNTRLVKLSRNLGVSSFDFVVY